MRNQKGITLIALVITIIVMLILAGVSIAMLTGDNGILTQATNARTSTTIGEAKERINLALNAAYGAALENSTTGRPTVDNVIAHDSANFRTSSDTDTTKLYVVTEDTTNKEIVITFTSGDISVEGRISTEAPDFEMTAAAEI